MCPHCIAAGIACAVASIPGALYLKAKLDEHRRRKAEQPKEQA